MGMVTNLSQFIIASLRPAYRGTSSLLQFRRQGDAVKDLLAVGSTHHGPLSGTFVFLSTLAFDYLVMISARTKSGAYQFGGVGEDKNLLFFR